MNKMTRYLRKAVSSFALFIACTLIVPGNCARADYRMGAERTGAFDISENTLYDEYGRVDFKTVSEGKVKAQDEIKKNGKDNKIFSVVENGNWRITVESARISYDEGEPIDVRAYIEYIGPKKSIKISVCEPFAGFYLESSTGVRICQYAAYSTSEPYPPMKFKKGKKYEVKLDFHEQDITNINEGSYGYSTEKAVAAFHDKNGAFILPKGTYTVKAGMTDRASKRGTKSRRTGFFATLHFNVGVDGELFAAGQNLFRTLGEDEAVLIGNSAEAQTSYNGDITGDEWIIPSAVEYKGKKRSVTVIGDEGRSEVAVDPDDGGSYTVRYSAFEGKSFSSVYIPSSVKKISKGALAGMHGINVLMIDAKDIEIGEEAFAGCSWGIAEGRPGKLIINAQNVNIGKKAFTNCYLLQDINIKASKNLKIEDEAFLSCYNLYRVRLPKKTRYLGDKAFYDCGWDKKLSITIPAGVEHIGSSVVNRANLKLSKENKNYKTQNGIIVTADGKTAVRVMSRKQKEIVIPDTVTTILEGAFDRCKAESLTIPDSVTVIPDDMIRDDVHLKDLNFGKGITSIGNHAFYNTSMKTVTLPDTVRSVGDSAFGNGRKLTSVRMNNGLETIGNYAFSSCSKLKGLVVPNTVRSVGTHFVSINYNYSGFSVDFEPGNPGYEQYGNDVIRPGTGELRYIIDTPVTYDEEEHNADHYRYYTKISDRVTSIGRVGLIGYTSSVVLPESLEKLDIAFLTVINDHEEGSTIVFTGNKPPLITNKFDTTEPFSTLAVIPDDADAEAYRKAFEDAGLGRFQKINIIKKNTFEQGW